MGFNDRHGAYHSADCPEVMRGVACSGGIGGAGALHCASGRTIHTAPRAAVPKYSSLCIRSRSAMHTPSERDGNRTRRSLGFGGPTVPRAHAHDSFFRTTGRGI